MRIHNCDRTLVVGILNCTPDSFSDGNDYLDPDKAIVRGLEMLAQGADIIDIGGESTRPGAARPTAAQEAKRVLLVIEELAKAGGVISVDTMRESVAVKAVNAGATMINDVSGGLTDPKMLAAIAEMGVGYIVQHWRGSGGKMSLTSDYGDVVKDVRAELLARVEACLEAGIVQENIVLDPGLGFAKNAEQNWAILNQLDVLIETGWPLLIGASRKRFLGELLAVNGEPRTARELDDATVALSALLAAKRVWAVRTHTVRPQRDAIAVAGRLTPAELG